jgi:hypothetical protein
MDNLDRLNLQKMLKTNDVQDCTESIRTNRHSSLIHKDVQELLDLKKKYFRLKNSNPNQFDAMCVSKCQFLFNNYTDIFNKVKKDEIDLNILENFLQILKKIEDRQIDQHEGSFLVGKLLKEIYIDSALKKSEKLDKQREGNSGASKKLAINKPKKISYKDFKNMKS